MRTFRKARDCYIVFVLCTRNGCQKIYEELVLGKGMLSVQLKLVMALYVHQLHML